MVIPNFNAGADNDGKTLCGALGPTDAAGGFVAACAVFVDKPL